MKVLIFGLGQLGTDLQSEFLLNGHDVAAYTKFGCDVTNYDQVKYVMKDTRADLVINCAAMHHLLQCEAFPTESHLVNVTAASRIAFLAAGMGMRHVFISTDQVFDGTKKFPYTERDHTCGLNVYAKDKASAERVVNIFKGTYIVRTGCIFGGVGSKQKGGNFITKLLAAKGPVTMTTRGRICASWSKDLATGIREMVEKAPHGIYHLANFGSCNWFELAQHVLGPERVVPTDSDPSGIRRPEYSVLDCTKAEKCGIMLPSWKEGVDRYLDEIRHCHPELLQR